MDEKKIEKEQKRPTDERKVYTPPSLTVYGKLSELTGSGTGSQMENTVMMGPTFRS